MENRKAIINKFGSVHEIKIETAESISDLKENDVLIKIEASTVSATDIFIRKGIYPLLKEKPPLTLGYDFVGSVVKIGTAVTNFNEGDRVADVCIIGGNADYIIRDARTLLKVNDQIQAEQAACLVMTGMTAFQIFKSLNLKGGDTFLIHGGAGAIGSTLLQLCKLNNIKAVATASASKIAFVQSQGATAIDYNTDNYFETLKKHSGEGYSAAFDFTNQKSFNNSFRLLRKGGKLVTSAVFTSGKTIQKKTTLNFIGFGLDFGLMMMKLKLWNALPNGKFASFFGILDSKKENPIQYQKDFDELQQLVITKKINLQMHKIYSLDNTEGAHQQLDTGKTIGYCVIKN